MERTVIGAARAAGLVFIGGAVLGALVFSAVTMNVFAAAQSYAPLAIGASLLIGAAVARRRTLDRGALALAVALLGAGALQALLTGLVFARILPQPELLLGGLAALAAWLVLRRAPTPSA